MSGLELANGPRSSLAPKTDSEWLQHHNLTVGFIPGRGYYVQFPDVEYFKNWDDAVLHARQSLGDVVSPVRPVARDMIFVFGSNLDGNHAGGAARFAHLQRGAEMGVGEGLTGSCYALPSVGHDFTGMSFETLKHHVDTFLAFAADRMDLDFQVTRIGCGIAGFRDKEVAQIFADATTNCLFDEMWRNLLPTAARFWGTF
jgi:hypothetical protein